MYVSTFPSLNSTTRVGAEIDISSSPSSLDTTSAERPPSLARAMAMCSRKGPSETPITWCGAPAGFVSGPSRLKIVRTPSALRTGTTCFIAAWCCGANMNPKPDRLDAVGHLLGREVDPRAERLEHVGGAALRRGGAVAVLRDRAAGPGGHERRRRRDVERRACRRPCPRCRAARRCRPPPWSPARASSARGPRSRPRSRRACAARSGRPRSPRATERPSITSRRTMAAVSSESSSPRQTALIASLRISFGIEAEARS